MAPPCRVFPASQLESEIQATDGRARKGGRIDLSTCELFSMVQYECQIDRPEVSNSPVRCWPVQRWFRRCQDKKRSFMVETTVWEGMKKDESLGGGRHVV
ncbi:uncharacterized protein F4817DRAFT_286735 [Daldinia loculata]|uniref:uncharacterized protein n=1 Tax=Daldinia loculata TaxID=103429 RepID=UPI0020C575C2|nr:uncharacterized protein F4817DRAFT_286735 [Daldinia loculata]KAI1642795.1 hypothetical protein F4817DRAFT_286735 [Daldinia loculata]